MQSITIHPQSKEQIKAFEQMAKVLKIPFEKFEDIDSNLSGEGFKQSVIRGIEAYEKGEMHEFVKINREDLWRENGSFMKRFEEALTIEEARELSLKHVRALGNE